MHTDLTPALAYLNSQVLGKQHQIKLAVTCLLADGHLLIEDLPGMGKTTLSHSPTKICFAFSVTENLHHILC